MRARSKGFGDEYTTTVFAAGRQMSEVQDTYETRWLEPSGIPGMSIGRYRCPICKMETARDYKTEA
jgi:hypothetical protein